MILLTFKREFVMVGDMFKCRGVIVKYNIFYRRQWKEFDPLLLYFYEPALPLTQVIYRRRSVCKHY